MSFLKCTNMHFIIQGSLFLLVLAVSVSAAVVSDAIVGNDTQDILVDDLIQWLRSNGAYINDKLLIRHLDPSDPTSPRGVFAEESLEQGEIVCNIPYNLMIAPSSEDHDEMDCETINAVIEELAKDDNDMTPYGKYLRSQPRGYSLGFWSEEGKELFWEMTDKEKLPPVWIDSFIEDWEEDCDGSLEDEDVMFALMLVKARADYKYLVPFYDMMNHNNGKTNVIHNHDSYNDHNYTKKNGYTMVTSKPIHAGEELINSYNQCAICQEYYDWFGTPEMFLHFGFVESFPQRWLFDFARIKFDLLWKNGDEERGEVVVDFLVPPSKKGMDMLQSEYDRLSEFGKQRDQQSSDLEIPDYELKSLWEYYDALYGAIGHALESNATLVDDVWSMGDGWWVKDGSLAPEDDDEHTVRPASSFSDNDEL